MMIGILSENGHRVSIYFELQFKINRRAFSMFKLKHIISKTDKFYTVLGFDVNSALGSMVLRS